VVARLADMADWGAKLAAAKAAARPPHSQRGTPPVFCMCGRERTCRRANLYVWQRKELPVNFADVWQGKELDLLADAEA